MASQSLRRPRQAREGSCGTGPATGGDSPVEERHPQAWIAESVTLREQIYPANPQLSYEYACQHGDTLDERLSRGGVRIAAYLNEAFG